MSLTVNYSILFSSRRQHTRLQGDWSSDVCSSDLSAEQFSNITLEFTLDRDIETVAQDVRDKVSRVRDRLPDDIEEPVIAKEDADAQPFYWMALTSDSYNLLQLSDIGDRLDRKSTRLNSSH